MKKRTLGIFSVAILFAGIYIGYYVTAVRYEYIRSYGAGNEALIELDLLSKNLNEKVIDINRGNLIASFAVVDNLQDWSKTFNPSSKDSPRPDEKMESYRKMIDSMEGHFAMEVFGLTRKDLKRILNEHFGYYEVLRASQEFVNEVNERLQESDDGAEKTSEPVSTGQPM